MKIIFLPFLAAVFVLTGCSKSNSSINGQTADPDPATPAPVIAAGYGPSGETMKGPYWQLPAEIQLTDSIHDFSYCWAFPPYTQVPAKEWKGLPLGFTFCFTLRNSSSQPITIVFPPELTFISASALYQNVLVIGLSTIQMEANSVKTIVAQASCLNKGRHGPATFIDGTDTFLTYSFGPAQLPAKLQEVADILKAKHISMNDVLKADGSFDTDKSAKYIVIQQAIWEVTNENGLTVSTRKKLQDL